MPIDEVKLRRSVEKLMDALQKRVIENDELRERLEERDTLIEQLELTIRQLEAELRRNRVDGSRIAPLAKYVGVLITTAAVSFGGARGAASMGGSAKQSTH